MRVRRGMAVGAGALWALAVGALRADENPVRPGVGIGLVHLGAGQAAERRDMGKPDGHYALPGGVTVDYWANADGTERTFYRRGVIVQESAPELLDPLPGGITMRSGVAQVRAAHPGLRRRVYRVNGGGGGGAVEYDDDVRQGIAFEFARPAVPGAGDSPRPRLYAVIVHRPGSPVIPDAGETPK